MARKPVQNRISNNVTPKTSNNNPVEPRTVRTISPISKDKYTRTMIFDLEEFRNKTTGKINYKNIANIEKAVLDRGYTMSLKDGGKIRSVFNGEMLTAADEYGDIYREPERVPAPVTQPKQKTKTVANPKGQLSKAVEQKQQDVLKETLRQIAKDPKASAKNRSGARENLTKLQNETVKKMDRSEFTGEYKQQHKEGFGQGKEESTIVRKQKRIKPTRINPNSGRSLQKLRKIEEGMYKDVDKNPATHRQAVRALRNELYNEHLKKQFQLLGNQEKIAVIQGKKDAAGKLSKKALDIAKSKTELITTGRVRFNSEWSVAKKRVYGTIQQYIDDETGEVSIKRVLPKGKKARETTMPLSDSQTTRKDKHGREVVVYTSKARKEYRKGKKKRLEDLKARREIARQEREERNLAIGARRKAVTGTTSKRRKADRRAINSRKYRAYDVDTGTQGDVKLDAERKRWIRSAKRIKMQLAKQGNVKAKSQLLKSSGLTEKQYQTGLYLGKETQRGGKTVRRSPGLVLHKRHKQQIASIDTRPGASPAMNHAIGVNRKGRVVSATRMKKVSGKMKLLPTRKSSISMGTGPFGQTRNFYGTSKTINVPGKDFGDHNRGILMNMPLSGKIKVDVSQVLANLSRAQSAVRKGIVAASDHVGKKMLDIIEPYVPKDKNYMYQSARVNVDQAEAGKLAFANGMKLSEEEMYGVSISYNTPYAEMVYFDTSKAHGAKYNQKHGVQEKGEKETARWIEVAMQNEANQFRQLLTIWAQYINASLNKALTGQAHPRNMAH